MKISRINFRWRVVAEHHVVHECLESLALLQGYRVNAVCHELHLSEAYFREIFQRDVGLPPKDWMQWERMVMARRMLCRGIDPMHVSEALGFAHLNSFTREFRITHGLPPMRFLRLRRPDDS
jgi:AraC-like DNA-binding protein